MQRSNAIEPTSAPNGNRPVGARPTPDKKDIAMLYVFNSANSVQIAWNGVLPAQKANQKPRTGILNSFIRTLSAG